MTTLQNNIVVLNNGTIVTFENEMTHEAEVARNDKMYEGVTLEPNGDGGFTSTGMQFNNYIKGTEAALPFLIKKVEFAGTEFPFNNDWLKKLTQRDYRLLKEHVDIMIAEVSKSTEKGKKNSGGSGNDTANAGGTDIPA